jgi:hypothetical protein
LKVAASASRALPSQRRAPEAWANDAIDRLVAEVTAGFKGDVGVVPRFLREFASQMDLVEEQ